MTSRLSLRVLALCAALCAALAVPLAGRSDDGRGDVRREGSCSRASTVELRLRSDDDLIRVELEIESNRRGAEWAVVLLHERRIAYRGIVRAGSTGSIKLRRTVPDWFGSDAVVARATGPRSESCRVSATL